MTKSFAAEVASRGVTVNCVAPGFIVSPMTECVERGAKGEDLGRHPGRSVRRGRQTCAACVAFLASNEAAYVTGQTLHVNGGMAMI